MKKYYLYGKINAETQLGISLERVSPKHMHTKKSGDGGVKKLRHILRDRQ